MPLMLDDAVIARQSGLPSALSVLAQRHEVMWRDGTAVQLHPVVAHGQPMIMLRAVEAPGARLLLVDLTRLVRSLDADLRATPERDQVGRVFQALRLAYRSATPFMQAAERAATGTWWPAPDGYTWHAAARAIDPAVAAMPGTVPQFTHSQWCQP